MDWFAKAFIQASLFWLAAGVTLGVAMAIHPTWTVYRPIHMHMTLLGFVTMMIYGVGYHVLPRFVGKRLRTRLLPAIHVWVSNIGLALMSVGFGLRISGKVSQPTATWVLGTGGVLSALGAYLFVYTLVWTMNSKVVRPRPDVTGPLTRAKRVPS